MTQNCLAQQFLNETCNTYDDGEPEETPIGGGGSSYGTGGGGTVPIFSDPVCGSNCIEPYEVISEPCIRLVNKTSSATYKQKFKELNVPANYTSSQESGFGEVIVNGQSQYIDGVPIGQSELIPPNESINLTHVHNNKPKTYINGTPYDGRIKILAPGDIAVLSRKCQIANINNPKDAFVIMLSDNGIFAITITEEFILNATTITTSKWNEFKRNYDKEVLKISTNSYYDAEDKKEELQIMLLKQLKEMGLENKVALFEGSIENENDLDINNYKINWAQKKLNKNKLKEIPCN